MRLDVRLEKDNYKTVQCPHCDNPVQVKVSRETVFEAYLAPLARWVAIGLDVYSVLWQPKLAGITKAKQLIEPLKKALQLSELEKEVKRQHYSTEMFQIYESFVVWLEKYVQACEKWLEADVVVYESY